jgi:ElaB/YqjD/DUF883 family membrane-anchored ribosome-binding protein
MTGPDQPQFEPGPDAGLDDLQTDIEKTRAELGQTAQALTAKLDVKARASEAASDAKERVVETAHDAKERVVETAHDAKSVVIDHTTNVDGSVKPAVPITAIAVAAVAVVLGIVLWRRRTR